jgi:hypothetical protein
MLARMRWRSLLRRFRLGRGIRGGMSCKLRQ